MTQILDSPLRITKDKRAGLRIAVIGCGAISERFHIPVLAGHEGVTLAVLVDRDRARASRLARVYGVPKVLEDAGSLSTDLVDAALVATPPSHHAPCCIELARKGIHILVEKPMAITPDDATAMAAAAAEAGVTLGAAYFRRLFPSVRLLRAALDREALGRVISVDAEEGDEYGWGLTTLDGMRKEKAGGGVLIDIGSHVLDLLLDFFPGEPTVLTARHNAMGGVETDVEVRLTLRGSREEVPGRIELSRTRKLRNSIRVQCDRGTLELQVGERHHVAVIPNDRRLIDPLSDLARPFRLDASWTDEPESTGYEAYRCVIEDWLEAIALGQDPKLDATTASKTVALIDSCYERATPLNEPWVRGGLARSLTAPNSSAGKKRILITGATGFIGGRLAEVLHLTGRHEVRALVHRPAASARLARLPIEMVPGSLTSPADLARAVEGCDAVLHCAVGTAYGRRGEIFDVTERGTRRLADAALAAGVARFVHLSSIAVLGPDPRGIFDEKTPVQPVKGSDYAESKAAAESQLDVVAKKGLPVVVLRPGCVYGPHSRTFTTRPLQYLKRGKLTLSGCSESPSNTLFVDNLVQAMILAIEYDHPGKVPIYTLSDGDDMSWGEFYNYFAEAAGSRPNVEPAPEPILNEHPRGAFAWVGGWGRSVSTILKSPELRSFGRRILQTDPVGTLPRHFLERNPNLEERLLRALGTDAAMTYRRPVQSGDHADIVRFTAHGGAIRVEKAMRELGYIPSVSRAEALSLTLEWAKASRIL